MSAQQDAETDNGGVDVELDRDPTSGQLVLKDSGLLAAIDSFVAWVVRSLRRG
jgi:hypothetical protein